MCSYLFRLVVGAFVCTCLFVSLCVCFCYLVVGVFHTFVVLFVRMDVRLFVIVFVFCDFGGCVCFRLFVGGVKLVLLVLCLPQCL